jgi:3-dehydroquinate dehydratase-2
MKIRILNGPNLNLLGKREPEIYGNATLEDILDELRNEFPEVEMQTFQSNCEGTLIDRIQEYENYDGLVINPGALGHYSYALADALRAVPRPKIEVHLSNVYRREEFRHTSVVAPACDGTIVGLGADGYRAAVAILVRRLSRNERR